MTTPSKTARGLLGALMLLVLPACEQDDRVVSANPLVDPLKGELDDRLVGGTWYAVLVDPPAGPARRMPSAFQVTRSTKADCPGAFRIETTALQHKGEKCFDGVSVKLADQYYWSVRLRGNKQADEGYALYRCTLSAGGVLTIFSLNQTVVGRLIAEKQLAGIIERTTQRLKHSKGELSYLEDTTKVTSATDEVAAILSKRQDAFWAGRVYRRYSPDDVQLLIGTLRAKNDDAVNNALARYYRESWPDAQKMLAERRNITERDRPNRGDARWVLVSLCATVEDAVIPLAEALPDLHAEDRESILREIGENARAYSAPVQEALTRAAMKFTGDRKGRLLVAPLLFQTKCHVPEIVAALLDDAMTDGPDGHEAYSSIALALCNYSDEASAVAHALQNAGPKAQLVVNGLMQQITNDTRVHKVAADAPGDGAPEDVLSAHFRSVGVKALGRLGPLAKPAVRFLSVLSITDPVEDVRKAATEALKSIEADAK